MTKPMVSERVAQKMSETQKMPKHLCIWETDRRKTRENYETLRLKTSPVSERFFPSLSTFCFPDTKEKNKESFTFDDFPAVSEVSSTSLSVCGSDETRTPSTFYEVPARACCCQLASAAPSCTQHEQVTNWYHIMHHPIFLCRPWRHEIELKRGRNVCPNVMSDFNELIARTSSSRWSVKNIILVHNSQFLSCPSSPCFYIYFVRYSFGDHLEIGKRHWKGGSLYTTH